MQQEGYWNDITSVARFLDWFSATTSKGRNYASLPVYLETSGPEIIDYSCRSMMGDLDILDILTKLGSL